jgi:hypothetical protein
MPVISRFGVVATFGISTALLCWVTAADEDEDDHNSDFYAGRGEPGGDDGEDTASDEGASDGGNGPTSVYIMEHGFLQGDAPDWRPRGTLLLSGGGGNFEARLSDAKEFVQLKPELQTLMTESSTKSRYYAVRMYNPETPQRVLQAAIPAKLLENHFEDWHDILEVTMGSKGLPVGLAYRVKHTLGLSLFDHTQVNLMEPNHGDGPRVLSDSRSTGGDDGAAAGGGANGGEKPQQQSFLRKYWWVIIIVLLLLSSASVDDPGGKASSGGARGGGGGGARRS